MLKWY